MLHALVQGQASIVPFTRGLFRGRKTSIRLVTGRRAQSDDISGVRYQRLHILHRGKGHEERLSELRGNDGSLHGNVKKRYYGRIEETWELSYAGEKVSMFRVRWAKS